MADASARPSGTCPWCGTSIASPSDACPNCGRRPDWRAWVDTCHAQAEGLAPPGWEGLATNEPLDSVANVTGYLWRELAALRNLGENGRGEFWLERANELYGNIFRALSALRIWDRPEQLTKATDCDEAERRLDELWRMLAAKETSASPLQADSNGPAPDDLTRKVLQKLAATLDEAKRELNLAREQSTKPKHLYIRARRTVVQAARAVAAAVDLGFTKIWPQGPWVLSAMRSPDDPNRQPATIQVGGWKGQLRSMTFGSGCNADGTLCDDTAFSVWVQQICPVMRSRHTTAKADAGAFDFPKVKTDDQARILGRDGKPLPIVEKTNPETGEPAGWHLQGQEARVTDEYDEADTLEHLRCQVADWVDACEVAADLIREELAITPRPAQTANVNAKSGQATPDENVSARLPRTDDEAELLKRAIAELLRKIPETWAEFDFDQLTAVQSNALFLLTAAGMVERRGWIRSTIANHPTCFELRFQATGEAGFVRAMEAASAIEYEAWGDAWRKWNFGETRGRCPFHAEGMSPQEWRLTDQGTLAVGELNGTNTDASPATVFDFVLKRGFHGPDFYVRKQLSNRLSDDEKRTIANAMANGDDPAQLTRPPVPGEGQLVEYRRIDQLRDAQTVSVANWHEGADALANAFGAMLGPMFERLESKTGAANRQQATAPNSPTGFLGGAALADALRIHATRRNAFFRQLERQRLSLGDDSWHEVRDPRPNSPRFLYRADSPQLRELAAAYKNPKTA